MKRIYVEILKQQLIQHHQYADTYIGVWDGKNNKWMIDGNDGIYEWDRKKFYEHREKYVSLTLYLHMWDNEYFKQAYKELVDEKILDPYYDSLRKKTLYRFMGIDYEECNKEIFKDTWNNGPGCPPELMKQDQELKTTRWWEDLKREFYKGYEGSTPIGFLQLHHKTNEAYKKVLDVFHNGISASGAYDKLKDDLELLTEEEHLKAHNRK